MTIEEIRGGLGTKAESSYLRWQLAVFVLLSAAVVCSILSALLEQHLQLAVASVLLLAMGLVLDRARERRIWRD